jgi:glycosyltransferase involved in cell wall biosynthesis
MSPGISVLIPAFNAEAFLEGTLGSVIAQTRTDWEAIVVDNASTDGTFAAAVRVASRDARIRVYRNDRNIGPVRNWLRCVERARAPVAGLLFADDRYHPEFLARVAPYLQDPRVGFAYSAVTVRSVENGFESTGYGLQTSGVYEARIYLGAHYHESGYAVPYSPGCALFRSRDLASSLDRPIADDDVFGFYRHGAGPDVRCYWDCCAAYPAFGHEARALVTFTRHAANLSGRPEIRASYHRAWLQWLHDHPQPGVRMSRARARAWVTLRGDALRGAAVGPLGVGGALELPGVVAAKAWSRTRKWVAERARRNGGARVQGPRVP